MAESRFRESYSDHIVELRFKPNPNAIDHRGQWAEKISEVLELPLWLIGSNRIDVFAKDRKQGVFVTHANAGLVCRDLQGPDDFAKFAPRAFSAILSLPDFKRRIEIRRLGVRSKFLTKFEGDFSMLRAICAERCSNPAVRYLEIMHGRLEDIGVPLNFTDDHGNFNTQCGPMLEEQAKQFIERDHALFPVSFYFDVDYWKTSDEGIDDRNCTYLIQQFCQLVWQKYEAVLGLLGNA